LSPSRRITTIAELPEAEPSRRETSSLRERIHDALASIPDPELGIDILNLGLINGVQLSHDGRVRVEYTLTRLGCPAAPLLHDAIMRRVADLPGVRGVEAELVMYPPWTPERMSENARAELLGTL
jgi:metal-sulfur cluster biosynthetic enzyme